MTSVLLVINMRMRARQIQTGRKTQGMLVNMERDRMTERGRKGEREREWGTIEGQSVQPAAPMTLNMQSVITT